MNKHKLKIAWQSNAGWSPSGYGQQSIDIKNKLLESGWDDSNFALINMFGQQGGIFQDKDNIKNYPLMDHVVGSDAMLNHSRHFKADVVFSLQDTWMLNPADLQQITRWVPWAPIDYSDPVPMMILNNLRFANRIIAMSKFGQTQLKEHGFSSTYIPHHVDTSVFFPLQKEKRKEEVKINPNMFIFGMVAANKDLIPRKSFGHVLLAFQRFHKAHPNSLLYIHTNPDQQGGYPIRSHADYLGLSDCVGYPDRYKWNFDTPKSEMNGIYGSFDCLLAPSSTEGFMIPGIEAQACGRPVIVNRYTSMPELIKENKTGWITEVSDDCQHFMPIGSYMKFPNINSLYNKMEEAFKANLPDMGVQARKWVEENYALDLIWKSKWLPFLSKLESEIYPESQVLTTTVKTNTI